jgi:DNA-binding NarL/FixJ family response regulator
MNRIDTTEILDVHGLSRVLVIADDPLVREGLLLRLGLVGAAEPATGETIADAIARREANVLLWDLGPSGDQERELLARIADLAVPVIALVPAAIARPAGSVAELIVAGVAGVLPREVDGVALQHALDAVLHGLCVIDRGQINAAFASPELELDPAPARVEHDSLTAREHEVVQLMAEGLSNKQIADRLGISSHTAKFHVNAVLAKLDASTRTEAVVRALQRGVVML